MSDLIDRQAAIDECYPITVDGEVYEVVQIETLMGLPSVQPEKRTEERTKTHACDLIDRQAAIDALDVLCQEHRYRIPGKRETYSQYNEAWQDALDRAEGAIGNLPSAQPEIIRCKDCKWYGRVDKRRFYRGMDCLQKRIDTIVPDRDFCSKAERRGEQDDSF